MMRKQLLMVTCLVTMVSMSVLAQQWTGTWATAMQTMAEKDRIQTDITGYTLRQVLRTSIGGSQLRLQLSNMYSDGPMEIGSVYIAEAADSCDIVPKSARYLTFSGKKSVTLKQGEELWSDALSFDVKPLQRLTVTMYVTKSPHAPTIHRAPLATTYLMKGAQKPKARFLPQYKAERWFTVATMEVMSELPAMVCIGNSITDAALRDPADPARLQKQYQADWLHPNPAGYAVMGRLVAEFIRNSLK